MPVVDRLTHHVHILEMNGDSYRLKQSKRALGTPSPKLSRPISPKPDRNTQEAPSRGLLVTLADAFLLRPADASLLWR
jgi:hypothetical protein